MGRIAAIASDTGGPLNVFAGKCTAVTARSAVVAGAGRPADADPLADAPAMNLRTQGIDGADDFVAGHAGIHQSRHVTLDGQGVAMAHAAGMHAQSYLLAGRLWQWSLLQLQPASRLCHDHGTHIDHRNPLAIRHLEADGKHSLDHPTADSAQDARRTATFVRCRMHERFHQDRHRSAHPQSQGTG